MSFGLRIVLPSILVMTVLIDQTSRALPLDAWSFRAWEAMSVDRAPTTPFEPSRQYDSNKAFGDLANLGNLRRLRVYRHERFTTDAYGFRNPPGLAESGKTSVLLLGDSMAAGSGVSDELTLSGQMTSSWGRPTYVLAPMLPTPATLTRFVGILGLKEGGWIVHQVTYLYNETSAWSVEPRRYPPVHPIDRWRRSYRVDAWPMRILANRVTRAVQDDRIASNPFASNVRIAKLQNGDEMLFWPTDTVSVERTDQTRKDVAATVRYLRSLADEARKSSLGWLVVIVPTKFAVYAPLTTTSPDMSRAGMPGHLAELEMQLKEAGINVLNLFPVLNTRARIEVPRFRYLYWRDDTHWNDLGISVAAQAIVRFMVDQERVRNEISTRDHRDAIK